MSKASNPRDRDRLLRLAEAVGEGTDIDWEAAGAAGEGDTVLRLRMLASVAAAHRALPALGVPAGAGGPGFGANDDLDRWGELLVGEKIGQALWGEVYRARHDSGRDAALVLRRADWPTDDAFDRRFTDEMERRTGITHPHLLQVLGFAKHAGRIGVWTELVTGASLDELVVIRGRFSPEDAAAIGVTLAGAVAALHGAGLARRDLRGGRVLKSADDRYLFCDVGLVLESSPHLPRPAATARPDDRAAALEDLRALAGLLLGLRRGAVSGTAPDPTAASSLVEHLGRIHDDPSTARRNLPVLRALLRSI